MRSQYRVPPNVDRGYLPYRQAASAFMRWQLRRGLLNSIDARRPGSPWWRAINERLLCDVGEARALAFGHPGPPSSPTVAAWLEFIRRPGAARWYRAHNMSVIGGYIEHEHLAAREGRIERFFMNVVLARVLYTHAMVAAPRLALAWLAPGGGGVRAPPPGRSRMVL